MLFEFSNRFRDAVVIDDKILFLETLDRISFFIGDIDLDELQGDFDFIFQRDLFLPDAGIGGET